MAVHFNTRTKEPYLRLSAPHSNIIVTPHRLDQLDETCAVLTQWLNDPRVYPWLEGPPYPYLRQHAEGYIKMVCREHTQTLEALRVEGEGSSARQFHGSSPFLCIREVVAQDPETSDPLQDVFIGNVGLSRYSFYEYPSGSEQREEAVRQNNALPVGDGKIAWGLGCKFMSSSGFAGSLTG